MIPGKLYVSVCGWAAREALSLPGYSFIVLPNMAPHTYRTVPRRSPSQLSATAFAPPFSTYFCTRKCKFPNGKFYNFPEVLSPNSLNSGKL